MFVVALIGLVFLLRCHLCACVFVAVGDGTGPEYPSIGEDERMEQLFSTSFQEKEDEERIRAELDRQTSLTDMKITAKQEDTTEGMEQRNV